MSAIESRSCGSSIIDQLNRGEEPELYLRKRFRDNSPCLDELNDGELSDGLSDDEDIPGCPLPSTPEDNELLEAEVCRHFINFVIIFMPLSP